VVAALAGIVATRADVVIAPVLPGLAPGVRATVTAETLAGPQNIAMAIRLVNGLLIFKLPAPQDIIFCAYMNFILS
jgi:hypothetical protein